MVGSWCSPIGRIFKAATWKKGLAEMAEQTNAMIDDQKDLVAIQVNRAI
jgi:hypothetical protein